MSRLPDPNFFHGVQQLCDCGNGWFAALRLTERLVELNSEILPDCPFARSAAAIRMEFTTAASEVVFDYRHRECPWFREYFDIQENGVLTAAVEVRETDCETVVYRKRFPGCSRLRITLPVSRCVELRLPDSAAWSPVRRQGPAVLVFGDSISQGLMAEHPSQTLYSRLAEQEGWEVLNLSVGGNCFDPRLIDQDLAFKPDLVIAAFGTNDIFLNILKRHDASGVATAIPEFCSRLTAVYPRVRRVLIEPPDSLKLHLPELPEPGEERLPELYADIRRLIRNAGDRYGFTVIPQETVFCAHPDFFRDHVHPNDLGFRLMADALAPQFRRLLNTSAR